MEIMNIEDARRRERLSELKKRYLAIAEIYDVSTDGITPEELENIERTLNVTLPDDMRYISTFYDGDMLGDIDCLRFVGKGGSIVGETLRMRKTAGLAERYAVIAKPPEGVVLLDTQGSPAVLWLDIDGGDCGSIADMLEEQDAETWETYADFFEELLSEEEE